MDFKAEIAKLIASDELLYEEVLALLMPPKDISMGDICLPCFKFAKALRMSPVTIAEKLASSLVLPTFISSCTAVAGYLNFKYNTGYFAKTVLDKILLESDLYGASDSGKGKTICIDYSSVNIAKPFHIGHLSTTVIGAALYRLFKTLGYSCVGINHLGDWGTQFGKMIVAYKKWGQRDAITSGGIKELHKLYVRFHKEAEQDASLDEEGRYWFKQIESGNPEALELFRWFKEITMLEVSRVYDRLGIVFDSYNGESFFNDKMEEVLSILEQKGLLVESEGAKVVNLPDMPPCLLVKADGATLYATRDLAAALYRKRAYNFSKCLYVVAYQQNLHFKQFFKVIELMGYDWANDLHHIAFGMVSLADGSMSSRSGNVVYLEDVINKSCEKAYEILNEKSPGIEEKQALANKIGTGAVIFSALINNRINDIVFSYEKILNFDGETCPYVQYTHARCCSVLAKGSLGEERDYSGIADDTAKELLRCLDKYPSLLLEAADKYEPSLITRHIVDICQLYNKFYFENRIIDAPEGIKNARLDLTYAVKTTIANALSILGIAAPEKM